VLYGTTEEGGTGTGGTGFACSSGCGTVFSLTPPATPGGAWTETVLHDFAFTGGDGAVPEAGVVIGTSGVLYGTTAYGGASDAGTVFSLTPPASPGGAWTETVLHDFTGGSDGRYPEAGVAMGKSGGLFGTTDLGGAGTCNCGTVFALKP
jgi:uncharacterized repeat protein (TIGR03803 family)